MVEKWSDGSKGQNCLIFRKQVGGRLAGHSTHAPDSATKCGIFTKLPDKPVHLVSLCTPRIKYVLSIQAKELYNIYEHDILL